jgi:hypothetical protein
VRTPALVDADASGIAPYFTTETRAIEARSSAIVVMTARDETILRRGGHATRARTEVTIDKGC